MQASALDEYVKSAALQLTHRGPDASASWVDETQQVAFAHTRLAIIDLSSQGQQPMHSASGRYVISYNGEIYNYLELRRELSQYDVNWRGNTDTEVILAAFEQFGVVNAVQRFVGMFAFAVWDKEENCLFLFRDRGGEKPLYYGWQNGDFIFASELKAFTSLPGWSGEVDRQALSLYVRHLYVPSPRTIYKNIYKLPPGHYLEISDQGSLEGVAPLPYWRPQQHSAVASGRAENDDGSIRQLETLLKETIRGQMIADVPLGAFLSGGIDSTLIVALMQTIHPKPVKTFTIGFSDKAYDESVYAKKIAQFLGTEHTELIVSPEDAMAVIPELPEIYDEPFADASQLPTYLVSKITREHVTVSLSGDAGDELFGGYNRYYWVSNIWSKISFLPRSSRKYLAVMLQSCSPVQYDLFFRSLNALLPQGARLRLPGEKIHKLASVLTAGCAEDIYRRLVSTWHEPANLVLGADEPSSIITDPDLWPEHNELAEQMMYLDFMSYLPDDILVKVDRAAMANSLETRVPFLDHRVCEFAWNLPLSMKIRGGKSKWILRQLLYRHVPKELVERPKMGFGIPIADWLRGPLKSWANDLLSSERIRREGYFNDALVRKKWQEHLSGKRNWQYHLWCILVFQMWLDRWK